MNAEFSAASRLISYLHHFMFHAHVHSGLSVSYFSHISCVNSLPVVHLGDPLFAIVVIVVR